MSEDTKPRLLAAAERILIEHGVHALTIRRVGAVSKLNSTLITYHFGGVSGLLTELCRANLAPMIEDWAALDGVLPQDRTVTDILETWLRPLLRPAVFTSLGRSLLVFDEVAAHGDPALSRALLEPMLGVSLRVQAALRPHLTHLDARELRARVRFISAAALGPPPRTRLTTLPDGEEPIDGLAYLIAFAEAALAGPRVNRRRFKTAVQSNEALQSQ